MPNAVSKHEQLPDYTGYRIGEDDRVTVFGRIMRFHKEYDTGVLLKTIVEEGDGDGELRAFEFRKIAELVDDKKIDVERGYFSEQNVIARAKKLETTPLVDFSPPVILRARMVAEFLEAEMYSELADAEDEFDQIDRVSRSDKSIRRFYARFEAENEGLVSQAKTHLLVAGKEKLFVSPRQFRRLIVRFELGGLDPGSLLPRYEGRRTSDCAFTQSALKFAWRYIGYHQSTERKPIKTCWTMMHDGNDELPPEQRHNRLPSLSTLRRMILDSGDYKNEASRTENKHRVARKYGLARKGLQPERPFQIVEMDEHQMDLLATLSKNGLWDYLHPDVQKKLSEERWHRPWVSVAMDAYSRSIAAMKILLGSPNKDSAIATLAMVAQPKTKLALLAGAKTDWPQCGTPEAIHTDAGAGYVAAEFQLAVMMYTGKSQIPPSKHPHLRARVERFFRTINQRYIHMFDGQTFRNPLLRDEYDSAKYAHITDAELADLLVRLIVDCYHNTYHRGIGMTPLEKWYLGSQLAKGQVAAPPTSDRCRAIFGSALKLKIGTEGFKIAGNTYSSPKVSELKKRWFDREFLVTMNEYDISKIAVKHLTQNKWITVPATFDGLEGVSIYDWEETIRYVTARHGRSKHHPSKVVAEGIAAVKRASDASKQQLLVNHISPAEFIQAIDAKIDESFGYTHSEIYDDGRDHDASDSGVPFVEPVPNAYESDATTDPVASPDLVAEDGDDVEGSTDETCVPGSSKFNPGGDGVYARRESMSPEDRRRRPSKAGPGAVATGNASAVPASLKPSAEPAAGAAKPTRRPLRVSTKSTKDGE